MKKPAQRKRPAPPVAQYAFSVSEFCAAHSISVANFYVLRQRGEGPKTMQVGARLKISHEAAAEWRRQREQA